MTIEEKARAYDEALERAKAAIDIAADKDLVKGVATTIFPELRESEDERIRKALVKQFGGCIKDDEFCHTGFTYAEITAWLEKQKEQKPNIELIQRSWYMEGYHDREFGKEPKWIIKTGEGGPKHELNPKYGQPLVEQRPTEEQLHNLNEAIKWLRMDGCERMADSLHSLYNILKTQEQKPAEWSEEDERYFKACVRAMRTYEGNDTPISKWIEALKDRVCHHPHWKPREEQISALLWCIAHLGGADRRVLAELYEHLKMYCK